MSKSYLCTVNGEAHLLYETPSVQDLLAFFGYFGKRVAVELNGEIVPKSQHSSTILASGDQLEIVVAVGGG